MTPIGKIFRFITDRVPSPPTPPPSTGARDPRFDGIPTVLLAASLRRQRVMLLGDDADPVLRREFIASAEAELTARGETL